MSSTKIGKQITEFVKSADKLVADLIKNAHELQQAAKEIKQAWKGDEGNDKESDKA